MGHYGGTDELCFERWPRMRAWWELADLNQGSKMNKLLRMQEGGVSANAISCIMGGLICQTCVGSEIQTEWSEVTIMLPKESLSGCGRDAVRWTLRPMIVTRGPLGAGDTSVLMEPTTA